MPPAHRRHHTRTSAPRAHRQHTCTDTLSSIHTRLKHEGGDHAPPSIPRHRVLLTYAAFRFLVPTALTGTLAMSESTSPEAMASRSLAMSADSSSRVVTIAALPFSNSSGVWPTRIVMYALPLWSSRHQGLTLVCFSTRRRASPLPVQRCCTLT